MAITINELAKAIRASADDPTGTVLDDISRIHSAGTKAIDRYALSAPQSIKDVAIVRFGQYMYDAPPSRRRFVTSALHESGASSLLAPYRRHRLGIEALEGVARATGVDRDSVILIIRELVSVWAIDGDNNPLPDSKIPASIARDSEIPTSTGLTQSEVDARIGARVEEWATQGSNDDVPDDKIPSGIARDSEIPSIPPIPSVAPWALQGNADDIPDSKIPSGIARDSEIPSIPAIPNVASWALQGDVTDIPDSKIPSGIARDSEIPSIPSIPSVATWALQGNADDIPDSKIPSGIARDSEIPSIPAIPNVASWALQGDVTDIPDSKIPSGIARDSEVPAAIPSNRMMPDPSLFTASDNGVFPAWNETDNAFVNGSLLDKNGFTWTYDATTNFWALDSDKVNQSEVDARINLAIPESRRIPSFDVGDAGEYLRIDKDGSAIVAEPITNPVTQSAVYEQVKELAKAGHRVTLEFNDTTSELTINVDDVPAGNEFPNNPSIGDRFRLLASHAIHNDGLLDIVQGDQPPQTMIATVTFGTGFPTLQSYAPNYSGSGSSTLAGKTFLVYSSALADLATNVIAYAPGASRTKYAANQTPVGGSYPHWYQVPTLGIATLRLLSAQAGVDSMEDARFNLDFASGKQRYPDSQFDAGDYTFAGGSVHWELTPGVAAPWAVQGQPEPRTALAVRQLIDGAGIGLTITNASSRHSAPNTGFDPTFDLNDVSNEHGVIECELVATITTRSANTIGFTTDGANQVTESRLTGFTFATNLRLARAFSPTAFGRGITINQATVYDGSVAIGTLRFQLVKDSNNIAGYSLRWLPASSAGSQNLSISATLDIVFLHNDAPSVPGDVVPEFTLEDANKYLKVSNSGTEIRWSENFNISTLVTRTPSQGDTVVNLGSLASARANSAVIGFLVEVNDQYVGMIWKPLGSVPTTRVLIGSMPYKTQAAITLHLSISTLTFGSPLDSGHTVKVHQISR